MGWYTSGPDGLSYKYGNVVRLARQCPVGKCAIAPRIGLCDEEGDAIEDIAFFSDLQLEIEKRGLPWQHLELVADDMEVARDVDLRQLQTFLADLVQKYIGSILEVATEVGETEICSISTSFDFSWQLLEPDWPRFLAWLNEPLADEVCFTRENLSKGTLKDDWYWPPDELARSARTLLEDNARDLALAAAGAACVTNEALALNQPDDDYEVVVWPDSELDGEDDGSEAPAPEPRDAALYVVSEHPLLVRLATIFGFDARYHGCPSYSYVDQPGSAVSFPPEQELDEANTNAGLALTRAVGLALGLHQNAVTEDLMISYGFHADASVDALWMRSKRLSFTLVRSATTSSSSTPDHRRSRRVISWPSRSSSKDCSEHRQLMMPAWRMSSTAKTSPRS
jgi:hypothetical protein